jgi:hypothetical protein
MINYASRPSSTSSTSSRRQTTEEVWRSDLISGVDGTVDLQIHRDASTCELDPHGGWGGETCCVLRQTSHVSEPVASRIWDVRGPSIKGHDRAPASSLAGHYGHCCCGPGAYARPRSRAFLRGLGDLVECQGQLHHCICRVSWWSPLVRQGGGCGGGRPEDPDQENWKRSS